MKIDNTLFNRLLALKKEGYTYLTSCDGADYTGYDQAVADCYEDGDGLFIRVSFLAFLTHFTNPLYAKNIYINNTL